MLQLPELELPRSPMTTRTSKSPDAPAGKQGFSLISNEKLLALYAAMLRCRLLEERIGSLSAKKELAAFRDQEAIAAGIVPGLLSEDSICAPRGDLAPQFLKGVSLTAIVSAVLASNRKRGRAPIDALSADADQVNVLPSPKIFSARLEATIRAARLGMNGKRKKIAVLFLSAEESADALWEASLRSAAAARLPVLFVCQAGARAADLARQAQRCGLPGIAVDREDVVAIYRVASEAIAHARRGNGPTLIEWVRWKVQGTHRRSSAGNAVRTMENYLASKGLFQPEFKAEVIAEFTRELDRALPKAGRVSRNRSATKARTAQSKSNRRARLEK
jgi:pyruvate dehydrogenase E1 component alpha subunit